MPNPGICFYRMQIYTRYTVYITSMAIPSPRPIFFFVTQNSQVIRENTNNTIISITFSIRNAIGLTVAAKPSTIKILSDNGNYLRTINAFRNMFDENSQINSQAEILLNGFVDMCDVNRIYVESIQSKLLVEQLLIEYKIGSINVVIKKELF